MSGKLPWMKFYPADWSQDTTPLSLVARGAWITIVCAMWRSEERGKLSMPLAGFCRLLGAPEAETLAVLEELSVTGTASRVTEADKKVTLTCRRMIREYNSHRNHALRQQRYRKAHSDDDQVTGEKSEVRSQKSEVRIREEKKEGAPTAPPITKPHFEKPTPEAVAEYGKQIGFQIDGQAFVDHYEARGWKYKGGLAMKNWQAAVRTWKRNGFESKTAMSIGQRKPYPGEVLKLLEELRTQRKILYNRHEENGRIPESKPLARKEHSELCEKIKELEKQVRAI